jgi:hypothetical protein
MLEIPDGSPWWLSPYIWTVPGNDPQGMPGLPVVGQPCYLWARVTNNGTNSVDNATVRFYWANPAVGFDRNTANHVGNANVSLNASETQDVLCLVPWMPSFVNGGHECVLAEAFHALDPLPASPDFNVPTDRHVAQRNLSVLMMAMHMKRFVLPFEIVNTQRAERAFTIKTAHGELEELKPLLKQLNIKAPRGKGAIRNVYFVADPNPCQGEKEDSEKDKDERRYQRQVDSLSVGPRAKIGLSVVGELEGEAALLHIVQQVNRKKVGGLSVLVIRSKEAKKGKE